MNVTKSIHISIGIFLVLLTISCNFNKAIVQPDKMPAGVKEMTINSPGDTTVVHFGGNGEKVVLTKKNSGETIDPGYTIENVYFKNSKGVMLNGWLLKPSHQTPTVTILHLHGNAGYLLSQLGVISPLAKKGFQVFMFDYSGFGFSQGEASRYNVLPDAEAALDYIRTREEVKNTKIVVYGQSLGGHFSTALAAKRKKNMDALVVEGAFTSFKAMAKRAVPGIGPLLMKQGYRADKEIQEFHKPVLIIHSTEDKTIPFDMGKKIYEAANQPKEFYEIKGGHIRGPQLYPDSIANKIHMMLR